MKTFNVPQFYNGLCCYFKSTCSSFDKVVKLFALSCLHLATTSPIEEIIEGLLTSYV